MWAHADLSNSRNHGQASAAKASRCLDVRDGHADTIAPRTGSRTASNPPRRSQFSVWIACNTSISPVESGTSGPWRNGRRSGLKIRGRFTPACGFNSHRAHFFPTSRRSRASVLCASTLAKHPRSLRRSQCSVKCVPALSTSSVHSSGAVYNRTGLTRTLQSTPPESRRCPARCSRPNR